MATIGNPLRYSSYNADFFSGNGSQTVYTLSADYGSASAVIIVIDGVKQFSNSYSISGSTLTFSEAPASGTNNIEVIPIGIKGVANTVTDGSITDLKLANNAVTQAKIVDQAVTESKLATALFTKLNINRTGGFENLTISNNLAAPLDKLDITADSITMMAADGSSFYEQSITATVDINILGAGGLDIGTQEVSSWYYIFRIAKLDGTTSTILSLSSTAPTMPLGYVYKKRIGSIYNRSSENFIRIIQKNAVVHYKVVAGSETPSLPSIISGIQGNITTPTWAAASITGVAPPTAVTIKIMIKAGSTPPTTASTIVAPNNSYGGYNSLTNPPYYSVYCNAMLDIVPESNNIYYAGNQAGCGVACIGWTDSI